MVTKRDSDPIRTWMRSDPGRARTYAGGFVAVTQAGEFVDVDFDSAALLMRMRELPDVADLFVGKVEG
jgi:hypothetical protein